MNRIKKRVSKIKEVQVLWFWMRYYVEESKIWVLSIIFLLYPERSKKVNEYPDTIQMPITYKCNFDCVMCGMRRLYQRQDFTAAELNEILKDKLFFQVKVVSLNGGEPFLKDDLIECIEAIIRNLTKLEMVIIISNGFFTEKMCEKLEQIHGICSKASVKLHLSLSVDGVGEMQNFHRGNKHSWEHMQATVAKIMSNQGKFFDRINIICTITRYNIYSMTDVETWSQKVGIPVAYNIATENVRIDNYDKLSDFSIFSDEKARQMAGEFFYCKFIQTKSQRYFGIYYYIKTRKRIANCPCDNNSWVTLTPDCQLGYCATHSKELGNALETSAYDIFNGNINYLNTLKEQHCRTCSHYIYTLDKGGKKKYIEELYRIHRCGGRR